MTIETTASSVQYEGNDVATTFSYAFLIPDQDFLVVTITDEDGNETVLSTSEYSVTGIDDPDGGIVTYPLSGSPLATLSFITIERDLPLTQETELSNQSGYFPEVVEDALDYITMLVQQLEGEFSRALVAPLSDPAANLTIPNAEARANLVLGFDADGDPTAVALTDADQVTVSSVMIPVVEAASLAAARTALGLGDVATLAVGTGLLSSSGSIIANADTTADSISASVTAAFNQTQRISTGPFTYTLARANTLWDGFAFYVFALTGAITLTPNAADAVGNLSAGTSYVIQPGTFARITTNGAASGVWYVDQHLIGPAVSAGAAMLNGCITEAHAASAVTFAVKTLAGNDPSTMDPVYFIFRSVTPGSGVFVIRPVTSALSITIPSTALMGFTALTAGRIWLTALDNAGTVELAVINCLNGNAIYPLQGWGIISTTILNTGSDSAAVMYSTAARTSLAYATIGYYTWETGLTTAGTWDASPTRIQLAGYGTRLPGEPVQVAAGTIDTAVTTASGVTKTQTTTSVSITPTSAANPIEVFAFGSMRNGTTTALYAQLSRGTTPTVIGTLLEQYVNSGIAQSLAALYAFDKHNVSTALTYYVFIWGAATATGSWNLQTDVAQTAQARAVELMA